jgi:nicotinamide-nucleotide amidase
MIDETDKELIDFIINNNLSIACAESCTGGLLTARLVDFSGVSKVLLEGIVAYSNVSKINRLGVSESDLKKFGVVSKEVAIGMLKNFKTDIALSTTGFASDNDKAGLVYIGIKIKNIFEAKEFNFSGDRQTVRNKTVDCALKLLKSYLLKD